MIEPALQYLDKNIKPGIDVTNPISYPESQKGLGLLYDGLQTVASIENIWTQKIAVASFDGKPKPRSILDSKIDFSNYYAFKISLNNMIYDEINRQLPRLQFGQPKTRPIELPDSLVSRAIDHKGDPMTIINYATQKRGAYGVMGEAAGLIAPIGGKGLFKLGSKSENIMAGQSATYKNVVTGITAEKGVNVSRLSDANYIKNYLKWNPIAEKGGALVKKSKTEIFKGFFKSNNNMSPGRISNIADAESKFSKMPIKKQADQIYAKSKADAQFEFETKKSANYVGIKHLSFHEYLAATTKPKSLSAEITEIFSKSKSIKPTEPFFYSKSAPLGISLTSIIAPNRCNQTKINKHAIR